MTYNQTIQLFSDFVSQSKLINTFGTGEIWEVEGYIKPGLNMPVLWAVPVQSLVLNQTVNRTFTILCFDVPSEDKGNEQEVISDMEMALQDFIKTLKNKSDNYNIIGDVTMFPFKEDMGDWCTGWRADITIESDFNPNECDSTFEE